MIPNILYIYIILSIQQKQKASCSMNMGRFFGSGLDLGGASINVI